MKKFSFCFWLFGWLALAVGCTSTDPVAEDFQKRREVVGNDSLFAIFDADLTSDERAALEFLYAYMPLPDLADYSGDFHRANVAAALRARAEMPWGEQVPEREFRHFVLPVRVNNEALDTSRMVFYRALKDRVRDLSMADAVLEVNHWCHEHVTYQPSDSRTSPPLSTLRTAYGRCGEESTFTVAALRAIGIPARQVYTPRWAHTDDNHAWVEAWVDGKWYFLGACEPEPVLNLGWFNAPASRGMLMHTNVFGRYDGDEEVVGRTPCFTEINVTEHYAPTATVVVRTVDRDGKPVPADVDFKLYNYAEFHTVASKQATADGIATLTTGKGDLLAWASHDGAWGYALCHGGQTDTVTLRLDRTAGFKGVEELDIHPPVQGSNQPEVTEAQTAENARRLAYEDSLRNAYVATFPTAADAVALAERLELDTAAVRDVIRASRGNYAVVEQFLTDAPADQRGRALRLLQVVSEKDRRDITREVLDDHFKAPATGSGDNYDRYVLNPRVADEPLTPYKSFFAQVIPAEKRAAYRQNPELWATWCRENVRTDDTWNPLHLCMSPASVWKLRLADAKSRNIFFVAAARSMGIVARIDEVTGKTQYQDGEGRWHDVAWTDKPAAEHTATGTLQSDYTEAAHQDNPKYYSHFTLSRIADGRPQLLNYDERSSWAELLKPGTTLDAGDYLMVSGTRMADGSVLARLSFFPVKAGETVNEPLILRESTDGVQVIGNFNSENRYYDLQTKTEKSLLSTTGRGYYVVGLVRPNHEPTNHVLRDLAPVAKELEQWGRSIVLLFASQEEAERFHAADFQLPKNVVWGVDESGAIARELTANFKLPNADRPVMVVADTFNRVVFLTQGYTIGWGEQLMKVIKQL